jgi:hypothetical protein
MYLLSLDLEREILKMVKENEKNKKMSLELFCGEM